MKHSSNYSDLGAILVRIVDDGEVGNLLSWHYYSSVFQHGISCYRTGFMHAWAMFCGTSLRHLHVSYFDMFS